MNSFLRNLQKFWLSKKPNEQKIKHDKSCTVYKTNKREYKIVTQSKTKAGYLLDVAPVLIISSDCPENGFFYLKRAENS
jgi:hypothetical protein